MYDLEQIIKGIRSPHRIAREMNKIWQTRGYYHDHNPAGIDVFSEDWDNLVILDACRADIFEEEMELPGTEERRTSRQSYTKGWVKANFREKDLDDVIYITNNGWYLLLQDDLNSDIFGVHYINLEPNRREEVKRTTEKAIELEQKYPNKRILVHFLPPHMPFIGPTAEEYLPDFKTQMDGLYVKIFEGEVEVSEEILRQAYKENLELMDSYIRKILNSFTGKTVISADHGEFLGDRSYPIPIKEYGHPPDHYSGPVVEIPWHICPTTERKDIQSSKDGGFLETEFTEEYTPDDIQGLDNRVEEHLKNLGYKM